MGVQALDRKRQVISLSADGGFTMLMGDPLSLKQLDLPVKLIVFNNGALGFIELEQKASGFSTPVRCSTIRTSPQWPRRSGSRASASKTRPRSTPKIAEALAHPGPVVVDAVVSRQELAMPPAISKTMAKDFTLYMLKAVLNGRTDEVVELAAANLIR